MKKAILVGLITILFVGAASVEGWITPERNNETGMEPSVVLAQEKKEDTLKQAFVSSKAKFVFQNTNGWSQIDRNYHSLDELRGIAEEAYRFFQLTGNNPAETMEISSVRQISLQGIDSQDQVVSIVLHNAKEQDGFGTYLVVDITNSTAVRPMTDMEKDIRAFFAKYTKKPRITHCIYGYLDRVLTTEQINDVQAAVFKAVKARKVEGLTQDGFISISGYTPGISEKVSSPAGDINIQLALRRNESEGRTFIWAGTPVITLEY